MFIEMGDQKLDTDEFSMKTEQSPLPPQEETVNNPTDGIIYYIVCDNPQRWNTEQMNADNYPLIVFS